ncbi:hypothetical protein os1_19760 [Comamonadaceae bacterium OS-1]|nr:hypothetical protein os1_19760 [Comamonadaceae bacterium OS-1]
MADTALPSTIQVALVEDDAFCAQALADAPHWSVAIPSDSPKWAGQTVKSRLVWHQEM